MAATDHQYQDRLQQEVAERAQGSGHSITGPGAGNLQNDTNQDGTLSREPSYVDRSSGTYPQEKQGLGQDNYLQNNSGAFVGANNSNANNDVSAIDRYLHDLEVDREAYPLPQGEHEYPGRDHAQVVDHEKFKDIVGNEPQPHYQQQEQQGVQPGELYSYGNQNNQEQPLRNNQEEERYQQETTRPDIQPSRSYIANTRPQSEYTQVQQPQQHTQEPARSLHQRQSVTGGFGANRQSEYAQPQQTQEPARSLHQRQSVTGGFAGVGSGAQQPQSQGQQLLQSNDYGNHSNHNSQHIQSLQQGANLSSFPQSGVNAQQQQPRESTHFYPTEQLNHTQHQQQPSQEYHQQPSQLQNLNTTDLGRNNTTGTNATTGAIAVGNGPSALNSQPQSQGNGYSSGTALSPTPTSPTSGQQYRDQPDIRGLSSGTSAAAAPIAGGGLGAALASSGHNLKSSDKKALKQEIKTEKKFEKSLGSSAKQEARSIEDSIKMAKASGKAAEKSGKHELAFRKTYDKAVKEEVKMKQRLLKITSEYNKVAAELEKATKESEIRKNAHQADLETRDADARRVDELRKAKGVHDMEREALHGESLTKQAQAKRALSVKGRPKSTAY